MVSTAGAGASRGRLPPPGRVTPGNVTRGIVVFAGPSIAGVAATETAGIDVRPPAACGDLARAARDGAAAIGLVDGQFESVPSTWHKEILWALSQGVAVFGAASMGALRAAETYTFGTIGVGRVYRLYRSGAITEDDEVALVHAPAEIGSAPLSEAMVNVRYTLRAARRQGLLSAPEEAAVATAAKRVFYKDRTYQEVFRQSAHLLPPGRLAALRRWVSRGAIDVKREDARLLLRRLRSPLPVPAALTFRRTRYWTLFEEEHLRPQQVATAPRPD